MTLPSAPRILGVGGREDDHRTLEDVLRGAGMAGVRFVTPADALSAIAAKAVDLLLVDVMQTSTDVVAILRAAAPVNAAPGPRVPVILTAPATAADRVNACLQRGAEDYLTTPLDRSNALLITRRLDLALQRRRLRDYTVRLQAENKQPKGGEAQIQLHTDASTRFVPKEFLENLERKTLMDVKLGDHVQRDMTVFFTDIRDFTALSEQLTPQQNFNFLNSYLQNVTPVIRARRGFIDKYIGDAIMALFPQSQDALQAAVELQQQVVRYNQGRAMAGYVPIKIGIGMHRGALILGTIGEEERMQTTVIADAVNVASRIEGLTKTFGVALLVSGTVVDGLDPGHEFRLRNLGAVKAKGKTQSVEIYECYDNDQPDLAEHKRKTSDVFAAAMDEFRKGMFLTAGRVFARIAEMNRDDVPAAYYRDRCTLTAVRDRGPGVWDGAEKIEVK